MSKTSKLAVYVAGVVALAIATSAALWSSGTERPGVWELACFVLVAVLLDQSSTRLKVEATGSLSFVIHIAAGIVFGGLWGGLVAGLSTAVSVSISGNPPIKVLFNVAQRSLSVGAGVLVYQSLGGGRPPAFLQVSGVVDPSALQFDLLLFFVYAAAYFGVNSIAVSGAVALDTGRRFRDVWSLNTRGVLGYDLGSSAISLFVAFLYAKSEAMWGLGSIGLLGVIVPIVVVRHIYALYHQLQDSGQELLQVMVKAIEARDPYTSGHSLRVSALSRTIALELGLNSRDVEQVETAALLHDVGKIHEEFAPLLRKESRLTPEETALMQTHSTKSAELVGIISKFRGFIQDSVRHHHERWDGQGYPAGLSGDAIPLGSRIILISDTIDAMTTDRPYRKRLPLEVVVAELQRCKGTQFEPQLVDIVTSSVAIRRLISGPHESEWASATPRSRRVSWPGGALWKIRGAGT
jgi:putative nucleotidyltransferase with HDIG domain